MSSFLSAFYWLFYGIVIYNYTYILLSARNEPPRVLSLQYIKFSLKYISVNETKK